MLQIVHSGKWIMHDNLLFMLGIISKHNMMVPVLFFSHWHGVFLCSDHVLTSENGLFLICHVPAKLLGLFMWLSLTLVALWTNAAD